MLLISRTDGNWHTYLSQKQMFLGSRPRCGTIFIMKKHSKHINDLFLIAQDVTPVGAAKIAAAIVIKNKKVSIGINSMKTHPFQKMYGKNEMAICLHAEIDAIKNALRRVTVDDLKTATLYVARAKYLLKSPGKYDVVYGLADPCNGCKRAIVNFGIKNFCYTTDIHNTFKVIV